MKIIRRFQSAILLIIAVAFLSCLVTGCSTVQHTSERQLKLEVPAELLQPVQPLITIEKKVEPEQTKQPVEK